MAKKKNISGQLRKTDLIRSVVFLSKKLIEGMIDARSLYSVLDGEGEKADIKITIQIIPK